MYTIHHLRNRKHVPFFYRVIKTWSFYASWRHVHDDRRTGLHIILFFKYELRTQRRWSSLRLSLSKRHSCIHQQQFFSELCSSDLDEHTRRTNFHFCLVRLLTWSPREKKTATCYINHARLQENVLRTPVMVCSWTVTAIAKDNAVSQMRVHHTDDDPSCKIQ